MWNYHNYDLGKNNDMGGGQLNNNGIAKFIVAVWLYTDS